MTSTPHQLPHALKHAGVIGVMSCGALIAALTINAAEGRAERERPQAAVISQAPKALRAAARSTLQVPDVMTLAKLSVANASSQAKFGAIARRYNTAMAHAQRLLRDGEHTDAADLVRTVLRTLKQQPRGPQTQARIDQTYMMRARIHLAQDDPRGALRALDAIASQTPIEDYRAWLRARAYISLKQYDEAIAQLAIVEAMPSSPMSHRARVESAHAHFHKGDMARAATLLGRVNELYPDYPRRYIALLQHAQALEATDRLDEAAQLYHDTWFAFPFRKEGTQAKQRADALVAKGHTITRPDLKQRYARARRLRINKHWDIAEAQFLELEQDAIAAQGPHSAMVHDIVFQLGLNALVPKRYEEAFAQFERLNKAYRAGHRAGIGHETLYKYHAMTAAKLGQFKTALRSVDRRTLLYSAKAKANTKAEFLKEFGEYKRALKILDAVTPDSAKASWSHTWLMYKSHEFTKAAKNFERLALNATGRRQAKYMYWQARTYERQGKTTSARKLFEKVAKQHGWTYYGIQANNRLQDMAHRALPSQLIVKKTSTLLDAADDTLAAMTPHPMTSQDAHVARDEAVMANIGLVDASRRSTPRHPNLTLNPLEAPSTHQQCQDKQSALCALDAYVTSTPVHDVAEPGFERAAPAGATELAKLTQATPGFEDAPAPAPQAVTHARYDGPDNRMHRPGFDTPARIHWQGRDRSDAVFTDQERGLMVGAAPQTEDPYLESFDGSSIERAVGQFATLFPELKRAQWLHAVGMRKEARWAIRDVALEYRALSKMSRPRTSPHQLKNKRMTPLIDNRRQRKATWGYVEQAHRWPVPKDLTAKQVMLKRQQTIYDKRDALYPVLLDAFKEIGDYYMVRRLTLDRGGIRGNLKRRTHAYPRAFADLVLPAAKRYGVNPYILWALMTVESSYNPDSVSVAQALGLLQVIPRTGLKIAQLLGDDQFGHYDLLDEDVALEHGAFYIAQVIKKFKGQELFAFAGYNGGPHRVAEWLDQRGNMPLDEFVEEIPYDQAREYTKKVTRFISLFLRTYEGTSDLYIGQNIDRAYKAQPNF